MTVVTVDLETTGLNPHTSRILCVGIGERVYRPKEGEAMLRRLMVRPGTVIAAHTNFDCRYAMMRGAVLGDGVQYHDTRTMAWVLDALQPLDLESLTERYCDYRPDKRLKQIAGRVMFRRDDGEMVPIEDAPWDELAAYNLSDLRAERALYDALRTELRRTGQWSHFLREEAPFSRLLVEIEAAGMPFDRDRAIDMLHETDTQLETLRRKLVAFTSAPDFNPGSGDQVARFLYTEAWTQEVRFAVPRLNGMTKEAKLETAQRIAAKGVRVERVGRDYAYGRVLLDGLGLQPPPRDKKQKTPRPSVNAKKLAVLYGDNPWVADYIEWRRLKKLSEYLTDWIERCHEGRLYGRFDQSGTATGRLAAREPNLQQVATDGPVRDLFRGDLVVGDFGGLEARLAAAASGDPTMLDIFRSGKDLYGVLAARAWGGPETKENGARGLMKVLWLACPAPHERLLTRDLRWVPAGDLKVGDELWTLDENLDMSKAPGRGRSRRYRPGVVVRSFLAQKPTVRVHLEDGSHFDCSEDHPWLAANGHVKQDWIPANRLIPGQHRVRRVFTPWQQEHTREAGWLAGYLDGEGSIQRGSVDGNRAVACYGLSVVQVTGETCERGIAALRRYGDVTVNVRPSRDARHQEQVQAHLLGGLASKAAFLGKVRPERLVDKFDMTGGVVQGPQVMVVAVEHLGMQEIQCIETDTHTYIGEGFPMHNSQYGAHGETLAFTMAVAGMRGYTPQKAEALLKDLEKTLPRLFAWRKDVIAQAQADGFVTTLAGRRRQLAELKSADWKKKAKAERQAVNTTVQGSAADVVRRVMLEARRRVDPKVARLVLAVHDELLWERGSMWSDDVFPLLVDICERGHGFDLDVPLTFEAKVAESWAEKGGSGGQVEAGAYEHLLEVA